MVALTWLTAHWAQLSGLLGLVAVLYGVRAQRASIRYSHTNAKKAELDISAIPAAAWEHAARAYQTELDLIRSRLAVVEPLAQRVPELEQEVALVKSENLSLRTSRDREHLTITRLKARVAQLVRVIEDMGGTVPPEPRLKS
jgi:hypothetical protein